MKDLVSLIIINYNNKDYLTRCMDSILNQSYKNLEIIFIDNSSKDGSYDFFKDRYSNTAAYIIKNEINNGYTGAANQGIALSSGEFVMIINPDIVMEKNFIERLHDYMIANEKAGSLTGKLLKYDFALDKKLNYIDSAGIVELKDRTFIDRGQNEEDKGQYDTIEEVFGACGAAPFYRRSALEFIRYENEYFDDDFFAYKEDIDLAWRLKNAGYKNVYLPQAVAYHGRGFGRTKGGFKAYLKHRKSIAPFIRGIAMRNQYLMLMKNHRINSFKEGFIPIAKSLTKSIAFSLLFEQSNLKYLWQAHKLKDKMLKKRKALEDKICNREGKLVNE